MLLKNPPSRLKFIRLECNVLEHELNWNMRRKCSKSITASSLFLVVPFFFLPLTLYSIIYFTCFIISSLLALSESYLTDSALGIY
jgi:hypothetical protein